MYDVLEVLFETPATQGGTVALDGLRAALDGNFDLEERERVDDSRQVIRIISLIVEFASAAEFEVRLRALADEDRYPWTRIGAVLVGQEKTIAI